LHIKINTFIFWSYIVGQIIGSLYLCTGRTGDDGLELTTVANQPGFPGCRPTDMERSARRRDFTCLPNPFSGYSLEWISPNLSPYWT